VTAPETTGGNVVRDNAFGLEGTDLNGRDLAYDGNGTANCFGPNSGVAVTIPASGSTLSPCPFDGANAFSPAAQAEMVSFTGKAAVAAWIKHPHAPRPGYTPLELCARRRPPSPPVPRCCARRRRTRAHPR